MGAPTIILCSGELSGDIHAAALVRHLRAQMPDARILAMGGDRCREAGAEIIFHYRDYAILGFSGVLANLPRFIRLERSLKRHINAADLFIAVDYPGLNLRLAAHARKKRVPVLYYIGPQVWAWGARRLDRMVDVVDRMAVILPFEQTLYEEKGIPVEFVGHPFVMDHPVLPPRSQEERAGVGLLPGSRLQEVRRLLPVLLSAAARIRDGGSGEAFIVGRSEGVERRVYDDFIGESGLDVRVSDDAAAVMRDSRVLLVASGTATLEGALAQTPLLIVYRVSALNYLLARKLITIDRIGLINVILGRKVAPELIQGEATPKAIAEHAGALLRDSALREGMLEEFRRVPEMLAGGGGCARVAEIATELIAP